MSDIQSLCLIFAISVNTIAIIFGFMDIDTALKDIADRLKDIKEFVELLGKE